MGPAGARCEGIYTPRLCGACRWDGEIRCLSRRSGVPVLAGAAPDDMLASVLILAGRIVITVNSRYVGTPIQPMALRWAAGLVAGGFCGFQIYWAEDLRLWERIEPAAG